MTSGRHVHLVGSMNLPSAEEAMALAAEKLGDALLRLPDGEPGPRRGWVFYQRPMFTHNRHLEAAGGRRGTAGILAPRTVRPGVRPEDIEFPETELFLGLVHHADGVAGARRRLEAAERFVTGFGVATECGIGRAHTTEEIEAIFDIHAALVAA